MGCITLLFLFMASLSCILAKNVEHVKLVVNSTAVLAEIDENYICATIDWWPHHKCNYNHYPWGNSSAINLDLDHPLLSRAIQEDLCWAIWCKPLFQAQGCLELLLLSRIRANVVSQLSPSLYSTWLQELVDCDTEVNQGCNGGMMDSAFDYIKKKGGIITEDQYPCQAEDRTCDV